MNAIETGLALVVSDEGLQLVVTELAATMRRELGPVAWTTLQVIALRSRPSHDGRLVAGLSGRDIALRSAWDGMPRPKPSPCCGAEVCSGSRSSAAATAASGVTSS